MKCNCGQEARYAHVTNGVETASCNKYMVCPTYDELADWCNTASRLAREYKHIAEILSTYKEGTTMYTEAVERLELIKDSQGY